MRVLCIRHDDAPPDDRVATWCALHGLEADHRYPFAGDTCGEITDDLRAIVIYGGPYNAYDTQKHPFLREEYRVLDAALTSGTPVLGLCQGAQMIAHHLGAFAGAPGHGSHEFGYYEVTPTTDGRGILPAPMHVTQAHFHTFDVPDGATHLARSALFENQAFCLGRKVYGFQFHPEQTIAGFERWMARGHAWGSYDQPGAQTPAQQKRLMHQHDPAQHAWFMAFLDQFLGATG